MYSPFPGMDPYMERADRWSGVHAGMIAVIREILTRRLAPDFFVDSEDNLYILDAADPARVVVLPDRYLVAAGRDESRLPARGHASTALLLDLPVDLEIRAPYLRIVDTTNRQVVTTIEILSPVNKVQGSSGQREFLHKRAQVLHSDTHWLEIDLLRAGARLADIPPESAYAVLLHRAGSAKFEAWIAGVRDPLPTIAVPLCATLAGAPLDLQEVVETVYDRYRYDTAIDDAADPPLPLLPAAENSWLRERIEAWERARKQ